MRWLAPLAVLLSAAPSVAEEAPLAVLPSEGEPALAARIEAALLTALAARRVPLLQPSAVAQRLRELPASQRGRAEAERALARAEREGLRMRRRAAVRAAREAVERLEASFARVHSRRELARACEALARTELLRPADEQRASEALVRALAADPSHVADPDRSPPRLRAILEAARKRATGAPVTPTASALAAVASGAGGGRVLWLGVTRAGSAVQLELVLASRAGALERHGLPPATEEAAVAQAVARLASLLGLAAAPASAPRPAPTAPTAAVRPPTARPVALAPATPSAAPRSPAPPTARPWYKRWWVWAIAGAVVTGTAVGLGVGLSQRSSSSGWEIAFTF